MEIKVLHLVAGELSEGAARGAYWLHRGLQAYGLRSRLLTDAGYVFGDDTVLSVADGFVGRGKRLLRRFLDHAPVMLYLSRNKKIFSTGVVGFDFTKTDAYLEADIIHLHWVNAGLFNIRHFRKIKKPIVWTLRDMWPMTGGCHYTMGCQRYKSLCGQCPQLGSKSGADLSRLVLRSKIENLPSSIHVVGISNWISECARESAVFKSCDVRTIFNNIDTQNFYPLEKKVARSMLGVESDKKIILIGAQYIDDFYKGFDKAVEALRYLDRDKYHLCFFGKTLTARDLSDIGFSYKFYGFLDSSDKLRAAYSSADVFLAPSLMDAFGKTMAESMACGTPVVCFDATGPKDIVDHKENGYRASPYDAADLAKGIDWVVDNEDHEGLAERSRSKIVSMFDSKIIAKQYVDLYRGILGDLPN